MEPIKVARSSAAYRNKLRRKRRRSRIILALSAAAILAVVLVIILVNRPSGTGGEQVEPDPAAATEYVFAPVDGEKLDNGSTIELSMTVGDLAMFTLQENADISGITFTSDNAGVVRVDSAGRLDALRVGTAKITATGVGFNAVCECTVSDAPISNLTEDAPLTTAYTANADVVERNSLWDDRYLYSITVNRRTNTVTVFTYNENGDYTVPVRAMVCSCGAGGEDTTPTGSYSTYFREEWLGLNGDVYGLYVTGFWEDFLFHSVPYHTVDHSDIKTEEFNKLGVNASQGCVRMMVSDVLWIYENCVIGTPVEVVDSDASVDVLGKPPAVKIDERIGWDPTDPDENNPYRGKMPEITGTVDRSIDRGEAFDPMANVTAKDICGNDITDRVQVKGRVLTEKPGLYYLTYTVTDDFNQTVEVTCTVIVNQ